MAVLSIDLFKKRDIGVVLWFHIWELFKDNPQAAWNSGYLILEKVIS